MVAPREARDPLTLVVSCLLYLGSVVSLAPVGVGTSDVALSCEPSCVLDCACAWCPVVPASACASVAFLSSALKKIVVSSQFAPRAGEVAVCVRPARCVVLLFVALSKSVMSLLVVACVSVVDLCVGLVCCEEEVKALSAVVVWLELKTMSA